MGGGLIHHEPSVHDTLLQDVQCLPEFQRCGWLGYFMRLDGFDEGIALEFSQTFSEGKATVKGLEFVVTKERIVDISGLPIDGENYPTSRDARSARAEFMVQGDPLINIDN